MNSETQDIPSSQHSTRSRPASRTSGDTVFRARANAKKFLPTMALGIIITVLALLFNSAVSERRLPAMAVGNRLFSQDAAPGTPAPRGIGVLRFLAALVNITEEIATDLMYAVRGPGDFPSTIDQIAVIAIDENSILRRGYWPWSRSDIALLVEKAAAARVIGVDLSFNDPDKTSLNNYVDSFEKLYKTPLDTARIDPEALDNDLRLARAVAGSRAVIGSVLYNGAEPKQKPRRRLSDNFTAAIEDGGVAVDEKSVLLRMMRYALTDIPSIRENSPPPDGEGFVNVFPTPSGSVRSVPLFAHLPASAFAAPMEQTRLVYPSLSIEVLRLWLGGEGYRLNLRNDLVNIPEFQGPSASGDRYPVTSVSLLAGGGELLTIPLNELGEMELALRNHHRDFRIYPAWEVLEGRHDGAFRDKLVLIGGTGEGVGYAAASGFNSPGISTVETHASMLSAMLKHDFMDSTYDGDYTWQQAAIIISGCAITAAIIFGNLGAGIAVCALVLIGILLSNYFFFFRRGLDVGVTLPLLSTLAVLAVLVVANYLVVGRERRFIRKAFSLNVSPSILGYLETHPDRLSSLQGENRNMTVLFSDIRGFTSISERMTALDVARFLNEYFTPMSDIVMQNSGTVDKFIGDGLMAFWNAPADNPAHAIDAACASLEMVARLSELQAGWTARGLPRIAIGCGINTGPMFAGYMGSEQRKNYTVMGDNVNIASRLENLNKLYSSSILITESTRRALGNGFICRVVDKVRVSGKAEAVVIYELLRQGVASDEESEEMAAFSRVFELYQEREFAAAESLLKELVFIRPTPVYKMYLDRLAIYKALPPPADWDGTFAMTTK